MNLKWCYGCFLVALVTCGCEARPGENQEASAGDRPRATQLVPQLPGNNIPTGIFDERSKGALKAWERLTENGRYRVANDGDFNVPKTAIENEEHRRDLQRAIEFAYVGEDFNRDGNSRDRAFIVVDSARNDAARFGLVIFNELADPESIPDPHWVYREKDLSSTVMSWVRGELILVEYHKEGTNTICRIKWKDKSQEYLCE